MDRLKCDVCGRFIGKNDEIESAIVGQQNWPPYPGDEVFFHTKCKTKHES